MGKQIYLTDEEIKWLDDKLITLSGMELYWFDEKEKNILDRVHDKITK